jgi:orotidine-5'-phosphate decarboxylase
VPSRPLPRLWLALDTLDVARALELAAVAAAVGAGLKLGKEFFTAQGPAGVHRLAAATARPVFLDLKFHDIPNTVAGAIRAALPLNPAMLTLHALGGAAMMAAAAAAAAEAGPDRPRLLAVTLLTSLAPEDLPCLGFDRPLPSLVLQLARLAMDNGADGVVCSPAEVANLRAALDPRALLIVPGVRPAWAAHDDQRRVMTPAEAFANGADAIVIGRPITAATDPRAAANRLVHEIEHAG